MSKVAVLLSGGIDSLLCAELYRLEGALAGCVFVDYGHPAQVPEGWKAFAYCGERNLRLSVVHAFGLDLGDMAAAAGARVVPGRNAILLALAANKAAAFGADAIAIGANRDDDEAYPDCREAYLQALGAALGLPVLTPLIHATKVEVVRRAKSLGFTPSSAWSCYTGGPAPCGLCPCCQRAEEAWAKV